MRYCNSCGTQLPPDATHCPNCGTATPVYYSSSGTTPNTPTVVASPYGIPPPPPPTVYGPQSSQAAQQNLYNAAPPSPYTPYPYSTLPITPLPPVRRRSNRTGIIVGVILLLLLLVGSGVFVFARSAAQNAAFQAQAIATAQARVTATARANAIATAVAARNPYTHTGTLAFVDPLSGNSKGHGWSEYAPNCAFKSGAYHAIAPDARYSDYCMTSNVDLSNFAFEVQMQVIKGDGGGIEFRAQNTTTANRYYDFYIYRDGSYGLEMVNNSVKMLTSGTALAINQRLNETNLVAVVAQGTNIMVYVNHQLLASVTDSTYSHGQIGVEADPSGSNGHPTEVVYTNAKVWTL
jgi:hypothetical protein